MVEWILILLTIGLIGTLAGVAILKYKRIKAAKRREVKIGKTTVETSVEGGKASRESLAPALQPLNVDISRVIDTINERTQVFEGAEVPIRVIADRQTGEFEVEVMAEVEAPAEVAPAAEVAAVKVYEPFRIGPEIREEMLERAKEVRRRARRVRKGPYVTKRRLPKAKRKVKEKKLEEKLPPPGFPGYYKAMRETGLEPLGIADARKGREELLRGTEIIHRKRDLILPNLGVLPEPGQPTGIYAYGMLQPEIEAKREELREGIEAKRKELREGIAAEREELQPPSVRKTKTVGPSVPLMEPGQHPTGVSKYAEALREASKERREEIRAGAEAKREELQKGIEDKTKEMALGLQKKYEEMYGEGEGYQAKAIDWGTPLGAGNRADAALGAGNREAAPLGSSSRDHVDPILSGRPGMGIGANIKRRNVPIGTGQRRGAPLGSGLRWKSPLGSGERQRAPLGSVSREPVEPFITLDTGTPLGAHSAWKTRIGAFTGKKAPIGSYDRAEMPLGSSSRDHTDPLITGYGILTPGKPIGAHDRKGIPIGSHARVKGKKPGQLGTYNRDNVVLGAYDRKEMLLSFPKKVESPLERREELKEGVGEKGSTTEAEIAIETKLDKVDIDILKTVEELGKRGMSKIRFGDIYRGTSLRNKSIRTKGKVRARLKKLINDGLIQGYAGGFGPKIPSFVLTSRGRAALKKIKERKPVREKPKLRKSELDKADIDVLKTVAELKSRGMTKVRFGDIHRAVNRRGTLLEGEMGEVKFADKKPMSESKTMNCIKRLLDSECIQTYGIAGNLRYAVYGLTTEGRCYLASIQSENTEQKPRRGSPFL